MSGDWLEGLAALGCTFLHLPRDKKRPTRSWDSFSRCMGARGLAMARYWLKKGHGVGILPGPGLWILDSDSPAVSAWIEETMLDAGIIPLAVVTQSGGRHYYFRFPAGFRTEGLKNHVCHPKNTEGIQIKADWKLGPKTMLVAPGTIYQGRPYQPLGAWREPPAVDPRMFLPDGKFWKDSRPFLTDGRPLKDRLVRARIYLAGRAPVSVCDRGGRKALGGVAAHLVAFLELDPCTAASLMGRIWNPRSINVDGSPCPWSFPEILAACESAVDAIPAAGVKEYERAQRIGDDQQRLDLRVGAIKAALTRQEAAVPVASVLEWLQWLGLPDLTATGLGVALTRAGVHRVQVTRRKVWSIRGLDQWRLFGELARLERDRQESSGKLEPGNCVAKFRFPGCDRVGEPMHGTEGGSAPKEERTCSTCAGSYVEQVSSEGETGKVEQVSSEETTIQIRVIPQFCHESGRIRGAA